MTLVLLLASGSMLFPAFELQSFSPEVIGIGGIVSAGSMSLNPSYAAAPGFDLSMSCVNLYGLKEIQGKEIIASYTSEKGYLFRGRAGYLGNSLYREYSYNCGYGYRYGKAFWTGANLNLYGLWIRNYSMCFRVSIDMGFTFSPTEKLTSAILFRNFTESFARKSKGNIPEEFYCSFVYRLGKTGKLFLEIYKDVSFPFSLRLGLRVKLMKFLFFVSGYQLNPDRFSMGGIIRWKGIRVSIAYFNHSVLPGTLYYSFGCCSARLFR